MINMKTMTKRVANSHKHKKCRTRITKIKIMTTKRVINNCNKKRGKKMMINMRTATKRVTNSYKHKKCKTKIIKIKITTIKKVVNSYSEKRGEGI
jgi:uncharacterized protein YhfF